MGSAHLVEGNDGDPVSQLSSTQQRLCSPVGVHHHLVQLPAGCHLQGRGGGDILQPYEGCHHALHAGPVEVPVGVLETEVQRCASYSRRLQNVLCVSQAGIGIQKAPECPVTSWHTPLTAKSRKNLYTRNASSSEISYKFSV